MFQYPKPSAFTAGGFTDQHPLPVTGNRRRVVLDEFPIGHGQAQAEQLGRDGTGIGQGARRTAKEAMKAAGGYDDCLGRQVTAFAAPSIAQANAGTHRPIVEQGQEIVVGQPTHSPFPFIATDGVNQGRHELFSRIALGKGRAFLLLTAEIAQINLTVNRPVKGNPQVGQGLDQGRRSRCHSLDSIGIGQAAGSPERIGFVLVGTIVLTLCVQRRVDAAFGHDRLGPFRRQGRTEPDLPALAGRCIGCRQTGQAGSDDDHLLTHIHCHLTK
ncbi:unknown [Megasphaera elsdenii CAG:570]|uniref:Uncharacterized protein n=1 Tax=Megasphaera elsdenii CAG:570 TaxID=1263087 RepID=R7MXB1_MEGEL|nr:unknown [Megasphaera elsdenii CAG:570]